MYVIAVTLLVTAVNGFYLPREDSASTRRKPRVKAAYVNNLNALKSYYNTLLNAANQFEHNLEGLPAGYNREQQLQAIPADVAFMGAPDAAAAVADQLKDHLNEVAPDSEDYYIAENGKKVTRAAATNGYDSTTTLSFPTVPRQPENFQHHATGSSLSSTMEPMKHM